MDKLRTMGYPLGSLTMDPSKGGLALQEASTQHSLQQLSYDPSFAERAAKYSTFGSSNYAQRSSAYSSFDTGKLRDVLENESIKPIPRSASFSSQFSEEETKPKCVDTSRESLRRMSPGVEAIEGAKGATRGGLANEASSDGVTSRETSSGSQPAAAPATQRKRKGSASSAAEGKGYKETSSTGGEINSAGNNDSKTSVEGAEQTSLKRQRSGTSNDAKLKVERSASENSGDSSPRSLKGATSKPPQDQLPKQDYIHVRARRGQATDSHSLAERVRREKISERMKFLQDLVPGCSKVTGKAVMLDEIINYVQSLQRQIEFLSMKLAAVNPRLDYSYDVLGKDMLHSRSPETTLLGPDPLPGYGDLHCHGAAPLHFPAASHLDMHRDMRGVEMSVCDAYLRRSMSVPSMASLVSPDDHFGDPLSQAVSLCNGDLQSVVEMGFIQGRQGLGFGTQLSHGSSLCLPGKLKVEL